MRRLPHLTLTQVRLVRLFTLLLVFTVLVLYGVFRSSRFQELLRRRTERLLTAKIGRTVTIGSFDLALVPFAFLVRDVAVANDRRGLYGPALSAAEIELRGLPTFTSNRIDIPKLRVVSPRAVVEVFPDGTTNLKPILDALAGGGGGGVEVRLKEAVIQRATLRFREWDAEIDAVLEDAAITARAGPSRTVTHLALACRRGRFRLENNETLDFAIGAEVTLAPGRVHLTGLRLRGDRLKLEASGGVDDLKRPVLALVARAETTGETLSKVFGLGLPVTGGVAMRGTMRFGEPGGFRIFGSFDLDAAAFGPFPMTGEGVIRVDPNGLLVNVTRASYAGGTLEALVRLERIKNPPLPVRIALRGRGLDFEQFFGDLGLKGTGLVGSRRPRLDPHVRARRNRARGRDRADPPDGRWGTALGGCWDGSRCPFPEEVPSRSATGSSSSKASRSRRPEAPGSVSTAGCTSERGSPTSSSRSPPTTSPRLSGSRTTSIPPSRTNP